MFEVYDSDEENYGLFNDIEDAAAVVREALLDLDIEDCYLTVNLLHNGLQEIDYGSEEHFFYIEQK